MQVSRGTVLIQRFFDIADEIDLAVAEKLVTQLYRRARFAGNARHMQLADPPLEMALGRRLNDVPELLGSEVLVRLYDVGALVVTFILELPTGMGGEALIRLAQRLASAEDAITAAARPIASEVRTAITQACRAGETAGVVEDYTIFYLRSTDPLLDADGLLQHLDVPRLLLGETEPIAERERAHLLHASFSYRPDDLVVVEWNAALILDPSGAADVPELLEMTSMQMLELRAYDSLVGRALDRLYKELEVQPSALFRAKYFRDLSRRIMQIFVDVSKISERIDNSFTFLGDTWLARIHRATVTEFGIPHWQRQLRNKLEVLRQINQLLVDQITSQKSLNIEVAVAVLIMLEIILALFRVH